MDYLQNLEKILESKYRLITIESYDTDRVHDLFVQLSRFSNKAYYVSVGNEGMHRIGASHIKIPRTQSAKEQLEHISNSKHFGVYILRDFDDELKDKKVVALLKNIVTKGCDKSVILLSEYIELPRELKPFTLRSKHQLKQTG